MLRTEHGGSARIVRVQQLLPEEEEGGGVLLLRRGGLHCQPATKIWAVPIPNWGIERNPWFKQLVERDPKVRESNLIFF
ncbi:hypothetical protein MLD38_009102 [Melastoma candidum]|uniref:Uncharacterized protein n=1 Tax=Melastoma candidum TaxID=119954 RepID=A0ACB9RXS1_9MYRT|nr:hypothetical protein MLD38_009102 [Melastoma candidum]